MLYGQNSETICQEAEDNPVAVVKSIEVKDYISKVYDSVCVATGSSESTEVKNAGKFTIVVECNENTGFCNFINMKGDEYYATRYYYP